MQKEGETEANGDLIVVPPSGPADSKDPQDKAEEVNEKENGEQEK